MLQQIFRILISFVMFYLRVSKIHNAQWGKNICRDWSPKNRRKSYSFSKVFPSYVFISFHKHFFRQLYGKTQYGLYGNTGIVSSIPSPGCNSTGSYSHGCHNKVPSIYYVSTFKGWSENSNLCLNTFSIVILVFKFSWQGDLILVQPKNGQLIMGLHIFEIKLC